MPQVDFSYPTWLINTYHLIGVPAIFLNSLGIYLLIWQDGKMGFFRYYLLSFQVFCTLIDIHLTFLMQPVPLYPLQAGYSLGILTTWVFVPVHYQLMFAMALGVMELESLVVCFAKKDQMISRILHKPAAPLWLEAFAYILCGITVVAIVSWPHYLRIPKSEQLGYINRTAPEYLYSIQNIANWEIYPNGLSSQLLKIGIFLGGIVLFLVFLGYIFHIFYLMKALKLRISASTYQKHQEAVKSLMVQLATSVLCLGPPCIFVIVVVGGFEHQQFISEILLCLFATHSSINVISLMVFFPPYQRFFVRIFRKWVDFEDLRKQYDES